MIKSLFKQLTAVCLITATLISSAACSDNSETINRNNEDNTISTAETAVTEVSEHKTNTELLTEAKAALPKKDYEGYEFLVADRLTSNNIFTTIDLYSEGENGDTINDAVFARNIIVEEALNIKIKEKESSAPVNDIKTAVLASEDTYDAVTDGLSSLAKNLAVPGYLLDLNELPTLNLGADWWDQAMNKGLSIMNKIYFITGDISIMDNYGTWSVMFNKEIIENFNRDDPYKLVEDGTWTLDKMYEMAKGVSVDLDGDGKMGDWDQYGILSENYNTFGFWLGSGEMITRKDDNDLPYLTLYNERSASVIELVLEIQLDTATTITGDRHSKEMADGVNILFKQGKGLFIFGGFWLISDYRDSEVNFGIAPTPKFEESQDKYYNTYSPGNCTAYSVPVTASDYGRTGTILEALAMISKYTLTPAYYDIALEGKFLRDEQSKDMLDLILANRSFDLCALFDWGGMFSVFGSMYTSKSYDFASRYTANEEKAIMAIDEFIDSIS
jgi:hypothetical protein